MSHSARLLLSAAAATAALAIAAPAASAAPVSVPNACGGNDGQYGDLPLQLSATAMQNGRNLDVSAIQPTVTVPSWLQGKLNSAGAGLALGYGTHTISVDAWMALTGAGSTDAPKVLTTTGSVRVNVNYLLQITGLTLQLAPSVPSSWHSPDAGGTLSVAQGPAGSLPAIPAGSGGSNVQPTGSLYIRGVVNTAIGAQTFLIDCQPGSTGGDGQSLMPSFTPAAAAPIVSSVFSATSGVVPTPTPAPAAPTPAPAGPTPAPAAPAGPTATPKPTATPAPSGGSGAPLATTTLAIASPKLKFGSAAVLLNVACPAGGDDCTGSVVIKSAKKLKVGKGGKKVRKLASGRFSVAAGENGVVKLKLTKDGKKLRRKKLVATVTLKPSGGKAISKRIRANG